MAKPYLVTQSDLKTSRVRRFFGLAVRSTPLRTAVVAAFLAFAAVLTEPAPEAPAPPVLLERQAPPRARPPATRQARVAYERAVDLYAQGRLRDSVAILETLPGDPAATRALTRIRADLASQRR